jgi:hypothetical protein
MSYPNHWQYEPLAKQRRQEISSAEEKACLLKKVGMSSPSLMDRIIDALRSFLNLRK